MSLLIRSLFVLIALIFSALTMASSASKEITDAASIHRRYREAWDYSPKNVVLDRIRVLNADEVGINVFIWTRGVTIQNSTVRNTRRVGLYLSAGSIGNKILNNEFIGGRTREQLSVDSSANNIIRGNRFVHNNFGGIYLYKNCHEHARKGTQPFHDRKHNPNSLPRPLRSNHNKIENNTLESLPVGIWVASRQSEPQFWRFCGDPQPEGYRARFEGVRNNIFLDYSSNNVIEGNFFKNIKKSVSKGRSKIGKRQRVSGVAILIEDNDNKVLNNSFENTIRDVVIGTKFRSHDLRRPVKFTEVLGNNWSGPTNQKVQLIYGTVGTRLPLQDNPSGCF